MNILITDILESADYPTAKMFAHFEQIKKQLSGHNVYFHFGQKGSPVTGWKKNYLAGLSASYTKNRMASVRRERAWEITFAKAPKDFDRVLIIENGTILTPDAINEIVTKEPPFRFTNVWQGKQGLYDQISKSIYCLSYTDIEKKAIDIVKAEGEKIRLKPHQAPKELQKVEHTYSIKEIEQTRCKQAESEVLIIGKQGSQEHETLKAIEDMNIGQHDRRVTIYSKKAEKNNVGQDFPTLEEKGKKWARVMYRRGGEDVEAGSEIEDYTHKFQIRYDKAIQQTDVIYYAGEYYEIKSLVPLGKNETLEIFAKQNTQTIKDYEFAS